MHNVSCAAMNDLRASFFHVWQSIFSDCKHGKDVAAEDALHGVQINLGKVLALDLLRGVVDKDIDFSEPADESCKPGM